MGPLKETTVEEITRTGDTAPVKRKLDEVEHLEIIEKIKNKNYWDNFNAPNRKESNKWTT